MIFRDAMRSLRKDITKAFFYWLIFVLTTMFIFLFFNISMSDPTLDPFNGSSNIITFVTILVLILCSIDIIFANDFYVKTKGKELAVRLICGGTFTQIASFLLIQTVLLLVLAIPLGIGLAYACVPLLNSIMHAMSASAFMISIHSEAIVQASVVIGFVVFWIIMLNLSFAYRNAVGMLMNPGTQINSNEGNSFSIKAISPIIQQIFWCVLFFAPVVIVHQNRSMVVISSIIGMVGLNGMLSTVIVPWLTKRIDRRRIEHPVSVAVLGFIRRDLQVLKNNIFLFLAAAIVLASILVDNQDNEVALMAILVSYIVMTFLQGLAMMFRYSSEISQRAYLFRTLDHIGYVTSERKKIIYREVRGVYGFILAVALLYIVNILVAYYMGGELTLAMAGILLAAVILPLIICGLINTVLYRKSMIISSKEKALLEEREY